jgi:heme exporter protein D
MLLLSGLVGLACLALTVLVARQVWQRERALADLLAAAERHRAEVAERQAFAASRVELADIADTGAAAATVPTEVARISHERIAAIPFGILEQIPATAETTKAVREIHDEVSRAIYGAVSGATRGVAGVIRTGLTGATGRRPRPTPRPRPKPNRD